MANVLIAYANRIDDATLSLGSWFSTLPLANVQDRTLGRVARSTNLALSATKFLVDFGEEKLFRTIGIINHNLSLEGKVRIRCGNDTAMTSPLYDSGWEPAWPAVYSTYDLPFEHPSWFTGTFSEEERNGFTWNHIRSTPTTISARYVLVEFDDQTSTTPYVQFGRVFIGPAWQPKVNMEYGAAIGFETNTEIETAMSGAEYFDERPSYRVVSFTTNWMEIDDAMSGAFDIQRRSGISREVIFQYDPDDTLQALRRQFLGRLRVLNKIEHPIPLIHGVPWEIKELL